MEETHREAHTVLRESVTADTVNTAATSHETQTDTATLRADERASVRIQRDSAGRIVEIHSERSAKIGTNGRRKTERDRWFYGLNATRCSEASDSVDSVTEKKEETTKKINAGVPLECIIGLSLCALIILFYTGDFIYRVWKRKQEK